MVHCAKHDRVELEDFSVYFLGGGVLPAYQINACARSTENPGREYVVRVGLRKGPLYGFTLMPMPDWCPRSVKWCSCEVGLQNKMCKHATTALLYCQLDTNRMGRVGAKVPVEVHTLANDLEKQGRIHQTSLIQRSRNVTRFKVNVPTDIRPLVNFGYISPHYTTWCLDGYQWVVRDGVFHLLQSSEVGQQS